MKVQKFWMVYNPKGNPPRCTHSSRELAVFEAERLARHNPGEHFFVLESVSLRTMDSMVRVELDEQETDIPF